MTITSLRDAYPNEWTEPAWEVALLFPSQGTWSKEEYLALDTNRLVEFSHGRIEVLPMPSDSHQAIVGFLYTIFLAFARGSGGVVRLAPIRIELWSGKFREPDLLFLASAQDPRRREEYWTGADLVVEVVSPDNPQRDLVFKRREYAQAGIPEYWIVHPHAQTITVLQLMEEEYHLRGEFRRGEIASSARFAGLTVDVASVLDAQ